MSNDYLTILQLREGNDIDALEKAYRSSRARYRRLTSRGPLRTYRSHLLRATENAYYHLKHPTPPIRQRPESLLSRQVSHQRQMEADRRPSINRSTGPYHFNSANNLHPFTPADTPMTAQQKNQIEDDFCKEVIYRLEGDLIRYSARQELLQIAHTKGISPFQANLLMAQIVQAVRQHRLYEPLPEEIAATQVVRPIPTQPSKRNVIVSIIFAVVLALIIDVFLIYYLMNS